MAGVFEDLAGEEGGDGDAGELVGRLDVGEEGGLGGEAVKGGELEAGVAVLVELVVGELVEEEPDDAVGGWLRDR